ncbi:cation:proton antiporter [Microbacterium sp. STN6]|uniref:cation:proton antiporter n=1 Tax=Microbacterium sp. STN6 TaxID=2995588 RepID=UPI0022609CA5|nr:cation:proton antiporter [Microbacterium sp. STN6]MCX7522180.1 cation:proton antiporter [Microbacterium sp. STN6]
MALLFAFAVLLLVAVLISGFARGTALSTAVLFLAAGFVLGPGVLDVIGIHPGDDMVGTVSKLALFAVLFTDGQRLAAHELRATWRLPGRALLFGLPLTFAITAVLAMVIVGLPPLEACLVAAVLAPTDPVFASAIVGRGEVPQRLRRLLNVESGLNDGFALPATLVLIAVLKGNHAGFLEVVGELLLGIAIGVVVPLIVAALLRLRFISVTPVYAALTPVAIGLIVFAVSGVTHANLYLAAFSAGITIATAAPEVRDSFHRFGELVTELLKLLAILVFGTLVTPTLLVDARLPGYAFGLLVLVLARPAAVMLALIGSHLHLDERLSAAWFGPKGFSSVVYALIVLGSGAGNAPEMFTLIVVAIVMSIVAHSSTDVPIAKYFGRAKAEASAHQPDG